MSDKYVCVECGTKMEKADEEVLVCPSCHHSVNIDNYYAELVDYMEDSADFYGVYNKYEDDPSRYNDDDFPEEFPGEIYDDIYEE